MGLNLKTNIILEAYGDTKIKPTGKINLICNVDNKQANVNFVIVDNIKAKALLWLKAFVKLNLVKYINNVSINMNVIKFIENLEVFRGVGNLKGSMLLKLKKIP